jgi:hypothetical protein
MNGDPAYQPDSIRPSGAESFCRNTFQGFNLGYCRRLPLGGTQKPANSNGLPSPILQQRMFMRLPWVSRRQRRENTR